MSFPQSAYGTRNPNAGRPANGDASAWGGWQWPNCPPANLLGNTSYVSRATGGQTINVRMRSELVPLWNLLFQIADLVFGYPTWSQRNGENWGPWGMDCRAVSGSNTPSGHSMGLSVDINAPLNPQSRTFQSDLPPDMVALFEQCGMFWGGRYTPPTMFDTMHFGYCFPPSAVAGHIQTARNYLDGNGGSTEGDWFDMATEDDLRRVVNEQINDPAFLANVATTVWATIIRDNDTAKALLAAAKDQSGWAASNTEDLGVTVWTTPINEQGLANALLAAAAAAG